MLETINGCTVISCTACRTVCAVGSATARKLVSPLVGSEESPEEDGGLNRWQTVAGKVWIQVRKGEIDRRWRREIAPKSGDRGVLSIREYPYLCSDCYEEGGTRLDESWHAPKAFVCSCGTYFKAFEVTKCETCRVSLRGAAKRAKFP